MAINKYPYTDFEQMNLDWLLERWGEMHKDVEDIKEEFSKIKILTEEYIQHLIDENISNYDLKIQNKLDDLNASINATIEAMHGIITTEYKAYADTGDYESVKASEAYADSKYADLKTYVDTQVLNADKMISPITGRYETVSIVIYEILNAFHTADTLTAAEYDTLNLSAYAYDQKDLTAYQYDFNGKTLLP